MTSSTSYAQLPPIPDLLYEMGAKLKKMSTWFWITFVCAFIGIIIGFIPFILYWFLWEEFFIWIGIGLLGLFLLIISCLGLYSLYLQWQYMNTVKDLRDATGDPLFEKVYQYLLIGFILQFVGLGIVTFILNILIYIELEKWATIMEQELPTHEMANVTEGYKWMKIGLIVSVCVGIAAIAIPLGQAKVGEALMAEYKSSQFGGIGTTRPWPMMSMGQGFAPAPTQAYGAPQSQSQTQQPPRTQPIPQQSEGITCPHCGVTTPKHLAGKFCGKCGKLYADSPTFRPTSVDQTYKPVEDITRCQHCGAENPKGTVFCESCGKSL